jgi:hypothetical protein
MLRARSSGSAVVDGVLKRFEFGRRPDREEHLPECTNEVRVGRQRVVHDLASRRSAPFLLISARANLTEFPQVGGAS